MKRFTLIRRWFDADRTIGELRFEGAQICFTMEPGASDTDHSRVPAGFYHCVEHNGTKFRDTWALIGAKVSHQIEQGVPRYAVLFHGGNLDEETKGCILPGTRIKIMNGEPAMDDSQIALGRLRMRVGDDPGFYLTIVGG